VKKNVVCIDKILYAPPVGSLYDTHAVRHYYSVLSTGCLCLKNRCRLSSRAARPSTSRPSPVRVFPAASNVPTNAPMTAHDATATGIERARMPARNPAAHPPAAPFNASSVCRRLATYESVKANVAPIAAKNPIVPPVRVITPLAPLPWVSSAFCTALTSTPTPPAWRPVIAPFLREGLGS